VKAAKCIAPRQIRIVDVDKPAPKPDQALIRVCSVGICGSDLHYFEGSGIGEVTVTEPLILGHEFSGIIEEVGDEAGADLVGNLVAVEPGIPCRQCESCRTGHYNVCRDMVFPGGPPYDGVLCEYVTFPADFCFPVPQKLSPTQAALIEPLAVALHTVDLARVRPGETAAILGLGPVGLLTAQMAKLAGAGQLIGTDLLDYRAEAGLRFGVDFAFNAGKHDTVETVLDRTGGRGVDVAFDCARSSDTPGLACKVVRPAGRCVLTGISGAIEDPFPVNVARHKELTLHWCRRFRFDFPRAIAVAASGQADLKALATHSFPLERSQEAFALVSNAGDNVLKASIDL